MKYHIKDNGEPGKCTAQPGNCPKKDANGNEPEHFATKDDAREGFEKIASELMDTVENNTRNLVRLNIAQQRNLARITTLNEEIRNGDGTPAKIKELSKIEKKYWGSIKHLRDENYKAQLSRKALIDYGIAPADHDEKWLWGSSSGLEGQDNKNTLKRMHANANLTTDRGMNLYKHSIADELAGISGHDIRQTTMQVNHIAQLPPDERTPATVEAFQGAFKNQSRGFTYVDIETNGGHPSTSEIIQIGVIRTDAKGKVIETYEQNFSLSNDEVAEKLGIRFTETHHLTAADLKDKPKFDDPEIQKEMQRLLMNPDETLVSHNKDFENRFFSAQVEGYREARTLSATHYEHKTSPAPQTDTRALYGLLVRTKKNSLEEVSSLAGVLDYSDNAHNALVDSEYSRLGFEKLKKGLLKTPSGEMPIFDRATHEKIEAKFLK